MDYRREHIKEQIAEDLNLLKQYENVRRTETDPANKARWKARIKELKQLMQEREEELKSISTSNMEEKSELNEVPLLSKRGVDYTKLRDLLAAQKWKEADLETTRAIFQAAGKQNGAFLTEEEVNKISCEDLRTVNQLWLDSSNEHFGFSVQKEIYERLGGHYTNPQFYLNEYFWENFGDSIGWRKGGNWLDGSSLTYREDAPRGHLPSLTSQKLKVSNKCGPWQVCSFALRLVACDI